MSALDDLLDYGVYDALDRVATRVSEAADAGLDQLRANARTVVRVARSLVVAACLASVFVPVSYLPALPPPVDVAIGVGESEPGTAYGVDGFDELMRTSLARDVPTQRSLGLRIVSDEDRPLVEAQVELARVIAARGFADPSAREAEARVDAEKVRYVEQLRARPPAKIDADLDAALAALDEETSADDNRPSSVPPAGPSTPSSTKT